MSEKPSALAGVANAVSGMPLALRRIIVVVLILVVGGIAGWIGRGALTGPSSEAETVTVQKGWQVSCSGAKAKTRGCKMLVGVVDPRSGQTIGKIMVLREDQDKDKKALTMYIMAPLGVSIQDGVALRLDSETQKMQPYKTCMMDGCSAIVPFDDKMLEQFKDASDGAMVVSDGSKPIDLTFSLSGFKEAWSTFNDGEAKQNSWFWRLWL